MIACFTSIEVVRVPCNLGVGCNEAGVCYASAHNKPEKCGEDAVVEFTIQGQDGRSYKFRQLDFRDFVTRAVELIGITPFPQDTDKLLNQWFELDTL
jgi:hypothetical protein